MENNPGAEIKSVDSFETSLKELEKIVAELEKGDVPLESQLKSFEKGVSLSRDCIRCRDRAPSLRRLRASRKSSGGGKS